MPGHGRFTTLAVLAALVGVPGASGDTAVASAPVLPTPTFGALPAKVAARTRAELRRIGLRRLLRRGSFSVELPSGSPGPVTIAVRRAGRRAVLARADSLPELTARLTLTRAGRRALATTGRRRLVVVVRQGEMRTASSTVVGQARLDFRG